MQRKKVYAYITRDDHLLVFRHVDFPEAGIQVPGGTLEQGEDPADAVLREVVEETGLVGLRLESFLGQHEWHQSTSAGDEYYLRYFYHLVCDQDAPDTWQHYEHHPSGGSPAPILFEFYWLPLAAAQEELPPYYTTPLDALRGELGGKAED